MEDVKRMKSAAEFEIDLELPKECWADEDLDEERAALYRMTFMAGYIKATKDAKSGKIGELITRIGRIQAQKKRRVTYDGPS
jgi:hypothetical protein